MPIIANIGKENGIWVYDDRQCVVFTAESQELVADTYSVVREALPESTSVWAVSFLASSFWLISSFY